jgi:hypothetical protein
MGNISVIGPRSSGKTTYLAGLACFPSAVHTKRYKVIATNPDTQKLADQADDIIRDGKAFEATTVDKRDVIDQPIYQFKIEVKRWPKAKEEIYLATADFSGEVFDFLGSTEMGSAHHELINKIFMDDVNGWLLLVADWHRGKDRYYKQKIRQLLDRADRSRSNEDFRIAIAMSKCERGELWPGRLEPEMDIFETYFPETVSFLREERELNHDRLKFFAISTFGALGRNDPRPNRIDMMGKGGTHAVLRERAYWQPYNLIAPLYWLSSGRMMSANA